MVYLCVYTKKNRRKITDPICPEIADVPVVHVSLHINIINAFFTADHRKMSGIVQWRLVMLVMLVSCHINICLNYPLVI